MAILLLKLMYFMLPAYIANMMPVLGKNVLGRLAIPVHKKLFGTHKTWRGLLLGTLAGIGVAFLQAKLNIMQLNLVDYHASWLLLGFLLGFGAMLGDLLKSFFKRRMKIAPGAPWIPFDQIDFVLGALALSAFVYWPGWLNTGIILLVSFVGHMATNYLGYALNIKKNKW